MQAIWRIVVYFKLNMGEVVIINMLGWLVFVSNGNSEITNCLTCGIKGTFFLKSLVSLFRLFCFFFTSSVVLYLSLSFVTLLGSSLKVEGFYQGYQPTR